MIKLPKMSGINLLAIVKKLKERTEMGKIIENSIDGQKYTVNSIYLVSGRAGWYMSWKDKHKNKW